ncbi:arginine--tRNA ligase [Blattabacterium cuenoti]|uniref:arginine--tRNA ligase n=1 Tax=Blattabacterium cuenoti TaxID=1653831 RepID=UPI00163B7942|nr:arginine--tRNA ligase [Blattabacterium cuenoti]
MNDNFQSVEKTVKESIIHIYNTIPCPKLYFQYTKKTYKGDITLVLFPLSKQLHRPIKEIGENIGLYVMEKFKKNVFYSIVGGFLNFIYQNDYYLFLLKKMIHPRFYQITIDKTKNIMIEYSSPNANKPLHLGHLRNILIGSSIANILKFVGNHIIQIQMINDRGIHICKSMIAWKKFGHGKNPTNNKMKGDHFVGKYYNLFNQIHQQEVEELIQKKQENQRLDTSILKEARILLKKWEEKEVETRNLWKKMNRWVYDGFSETYKKLGVYFDKTEYESNIYKIGKKIVQKGLNQGLFFKKEDGSIWIDLEKEGFDKKLLLRSDQTSVYMTQDLGTAIERFQKYNIHKLIYVVGNEQNYHFQVLFKILKCLGFPWVHKLYHLSYDMVTLPGGKMKSREGNVVTADSLIKKMHEIAKKRFLTRSKKTEYEESYNIIGLGALKYHFLKVDPKKEIIFHPEKSIDLKGKTSTYIQYTYSRIRSLEKRFYNICKIINVFCHKVLFSEYDKKVIKILQQYPSILKKSSKDLNPSLLANYVYDVSKIFNNLYQNKRLINSVNTLYSNVYMHILHIIGNILKYGMNLLGINMIDQM